MSNVQLVLATLFTLAGGTATLLTVMTLRRRQLVPGLLARKLMHMATVTTTYQNVIVYYIG